MVRLSSTRVVAALALLAAAACTGDATSPLARAPQDAALSAKSARSLHTGKYRDSGLPHATGRSGSARLAARALLGSDGVTRLLVTTGSVDDPARAPGELAKVQLKAYAPDGTRLFTQNFQRPTSGGSYEFLLHGLPRGARIEVQANVRGIDRNRTDVVNVTATVGSAPVLAVSIDPPAQVVAGVPTVITGTVRETAGQSGAYTACVLYVDGVEVDRIDRVWVDAGDAVTCAFTHTFRTTGTHPVQIRLERDAGDTTLIGEMPTAGGQVNAVTPNPTPTWTATVMDRTVKLDLQYDETWTRLDGGTRVHNQNTGEAPRTQTFALTGSVARAVSFPLAAVEVAVWSDAGAWHAPVWTGVTAGAPDAQGQSCTDQLVVEQGAHFYVCSTGSGVQGSTAFGYTRFAGTVTYHSVVFGRQWDQVNGQETLWGWNNVSETYGGGGQMRQLGTAVSVHLEITDAVGTIPVNATVPLSPFDSTVTLAPYACRNLFPYWLDGGLQRICEGSTQRTYGWSGEAAG
ncbi:MAG TPA: hypothetical protein VGC13_00705 [Longimicrobium sp.]|jgi:hypothetical protein|uniref:hypothetical protein n=1 Tax=Longimicrobium sp. TaxID=2029185 RepID=UPI002ED98A59